MVQYSERSLLFFLFLVFTSIVSETYCLSTSNILNEFWEKTFYEQLMCKLSNCQYNSFLLYYCSIVLACLRHWQDVSKVATRTCFFSTKNQHFEVRTQNYLTFLFFDSDLYVENGEKKFFWAFWKKKRVEKKNAFTNAFFFSPEYQLRK